MLGGWCSPSHSKLGDLDLANNTIKGAWPHSKLLILCTTELMKTLPTQWLNSQPHYTKVP